MTAPIGVGDFVECVNDAPHEWKGVKRLSLGSVYQVRGFHPRGSIYLRGVVLPKGPKGIEAGWGLPRFRPIYRPKAELIQSLLAPAPAKPVRVGEDA